MIFVVVGGVFIYREVTVAMNTIWLSSYFWSLVLLCSQWGEGSIPTSRQRYVFEPAGLKLSTCRPSWHYGA